MRTFQITVRTSEQCTRYTALALSSFDAWDSANALFGDAALGISVSLKAQAA